MRRYTITVNDTSYVLDVEAHTADEFTVELDGRSIEVRLDDHTELGRAQIAPAVQVRSGRPTGPAGSGVGRAAEPITPTARPTPPPPRTPSVAPASAAPTTGAPAPAGAGTLTAPMPGVILSIAAQPGTHVERGDTVLVLEAMKMKNALKATRAGTIGTINVTEGQQVRFGDALATIDGE